MPYPGMGFPIPPFEWPRVGRQWPQYNIESDQAEGLVAWWPTLASQGENRLRELISGVVNCSLSGPPTWLSSSLGYVLDYDGGDFADTGVEEIRGVDLFCDGTQPFSVVVWARVATNNTGTVFSRAEAVSANRTFQLFVSGGITQGEVSVILRGTENFSGVRIDDGVFHQHIVTYDGVTANHYLDGSLIDAGLGIGAAAENVGQRIIIGARTNGAGFLLTGQVGGSRIYDRALAGAGARALWAKETRWELCRLPRRMWVLAPIAAGQQYFQSAAGVLTPAGAIIKRTGLPRAGTLTPAGIVAKMTATPRAGTLTPAGAITKRTDLSFAGALTTAGVLVGQAQKVITGTLTIAGALVRRTGKPLAGTLTTAGTITRRVSVSLTGTLTSAGAVVKRTARSLAGALTTAGVLAAEAVTIIPIALTLWTRSVALTLKDRSQALTLWARNLSLTLRDRE